MTEEGRIEQAAAVLYETERETRWCDGAGEMRTGRMHPPASPWCNVDYATRVYYLLRAESALRAAGAWTRQ